MRSALYFTRRVAGTNGRHLPQTPCAQQARRWCAASKIEDKIDEYIAAAEASRSEHRAQLKAQTDLNKQRTQLLTKTIERTEKESEEIRTELTALTRDFDVLAEKLKEESVGFRPRIQRKGVKGRGAQSRMAYRPSVAYSEKQPTHVCELSHQSLAELAMIGDHCARRERLLREVMAVDNISWGQAHEVLNTFDRYNEKYYWIESMPYRIGITLAFVGGIASVLMVFWKPVAHWYGVNVAGEDLPDDIKDVDELTVNQVGTWTWGWMEPMIGVASFVLLCCQFTRAQVQKINMKTYSDRILQRRADRLAKAFPQYDKSMVRVWAKHLPKVGYDFFPTYETEFKQKGPSSGL